MPESETKTKTADKPAEEKFSVKVLTDQAPRMLGVRSYVAAGAFHGRTSDMTVAEAKKAVDRFLKKEA